MWITPPLSTLRVAGNVDNLRAPASHTHERHDRRHHRDEQERRQQAQSHRQQQPHRQSRRPLLDPRAFAAVHLLNGRMNLRQRRDAILPGGTQCAACQSQCRGSRGGTIMFQHGPRLIPAHTAQQCGGDMPQHLRACAAAACANAFQCPGNRDALSNRRLKQLQQQRRRRLPARAYLEQSPLQGIAAPRQRNLRARQSVKFAQPTCSNPLVPNHVQVRGERRADRGTPRPESSHRTTRPRQAGAASTAVRPHNKSCPGTAWRAPVPSRTACPTDPRRAALPGTPPPPAARAACAPWIWAS